VTLPTLPQLVVDALRNAGATEEMIAAAVKASGEFPTPHPSRGGRPRKYRTRAACDLAYRERRKQREKTCEETSPGEKTCEKTRSKALGRPRARPGDAWGWPVKLPTLPQRVIDALRNAGATAELIAAAIAADRGARAHPHHWS
jgi:hypothetical protein